MPLYHLVLGMDIVGRVVDAGPSERFKEGDIIAAPGVVGDSDSCSFQTHALVHERRCAKINHEISLLGLATLPFSLSTAACGLYLSAGLDRFTNKPGTEVLIWGANGSCGKLAIQLAKLSGYSVIAVTSNEESITQAKARGADYAFANTDKQVIQKVRAGTPNLHHAFDTEETVDKLAECCKRPTVVATAIKYLGSEIDGVKTNSVYSGEIMGKTITGHLSVSGLTLGQWMWENLDDWLEQRLITPLEYEELEGLESVESG